MSTDNDKELDDFLRQLAKDIPLEEPNDQFTASVLKTIKATASVRSRIVHTPVFSRASWILIVLLASILLVLGYDYGDQGTLLPGYLSFLRAASISEIIGHLPVIGRSNILVFSFLTFVSAVAIQIVWLKKSWAKKQVLF